MAISSHPMRRIRSFVRRDGRMSDAQRRVVNERWQDFGLNVDAGMLDYAQVFQRSAPCMLEIGFGSGTSLLSFAQANQGTDFIGVEMYQPGIGSLLLHAENAGLNNIRVFYADAVEVLKNCIPAHSLDGVQIFFPDPWPKSRHHKRRLIQEEFVKLVASKLKPQAIFHLATDWEHYGQQMMRVLSADPTLVNVAGPQTFAQRSPKRPVVTKFEGRGTRSGRQIWELQFARLPF